MEYKTVNGIHELDEESVIFAGYMFCVVRRLDLMIKGDYSIT